MSLLLALFTDSYIDSAAIDGSAGIMAVTLDHRQWACYLLFVDISSGAMIWHEEHQPRGLVNNIC